MFMTDARGKVGGQVFSKNRSGAYVRTKVTPSNARTSRQSFIRAALSRISANWSALTDEQRKGFDGAVNDWKTTNVFGDATAPTGKTLYTKLNLNLVNSVQNEIENVPEKAEFPQVTIEDAAKSVTDFQVNLSGSTVGCKVVIAATPQLSQGTSFYKGKFRQIAVFTGTVTSEFEIAGLYSEKFGTLTAGSNVAVQVVLVLPNGQASIPMTMKAGAL